MEPHQFACYNSAGGNTPPRDLDGYN